MGTWGSGWNDTANRLQEGKEHNRIGLSSNGRIRNLADLADFGIWNCSACGQ